MELLWLGLMWAGVFSALYMSNRARDMHVFFCRLEAIARFDLRLKENPALHAQEDLRPLWYDIATDVPGWKPKKQKRISERAMRHHEKQLAKRKKVRAS